MDYQHRVLPFYMSYAPPYFMMEEDSVLRDLEYLQQMYPMQAKQLQAKVSGIIDKMDYEGSLIYDEYPDKWQLYRLAQSVIQTLKNEEEERMDGQYTSKEKWDWLEDMIQLILFYEIYKRRHGRRKGFLKF